MMPGWEFDKEYIEKWEQGYKVVMGQKTKSKENPIMFQIRKLYYKIMEKLSETEHLTNVTGYGLFDKEVLEMIKWMDDPDPYIRGLITQLGYKWTLVEYTQQERKVGKSSYNFSRSIRSRKRHNKKRINKKNG